MKYIFLCVSDITDAEVEHFRERAEEQDVTGILQLLAFTDLQSVTVMPEGDAEAVDQESQELRSDLMEAADLYRLN